jgi:hypothetical protein
MSRTNRFFASTRKNLPKGIPWLVDEIQYQDGLAFAARVACYCFDRTWAKRIAKALNAPKAEPAEGPMKHEHSVKGLVQQSFLESEFACLVPVS